MNSRLVLTLAILSIVIASSCACAAPMIKASIPAGNSVMNSRLSGTYTPIYSTNWAGYAITGNDGSVNDVMGSWVVPAVQNSNAKIPSQYSSHWIGMDGFSSSTVEQIGTSTETDSNGNPVYYAWYEFYPEHAQQIDMKIKPGDLIEAEVKYNKNTNKIVATITDTSQRGSPSFTVKRDATGYSRSSAEWISEAPYMNGVLPLTNFGATLYGKSYTGIRYTCQTTIDKNTNDIGNFKKGGYIITMVNDGSQVKAQPSLFTSSTSFKINWLRAA